MSRLSELDERLTEFQVDLCPLHLYFRFVAVCLRCEVISVAGFTTGLLSKITRVRLFHRCAVFSTDPDCRQRIARRRPCCPTRGSDRLTRVRHNLRPGRRLVIPESAGAARVRFGRGFQRARRRRPDVGARGVTGATRRRRFRRCRTKRFARVAAYFGEAERYDINGDPAPITGHRWSVQRREIRWRQQLKWRSK